MKHLLLFFLINILFLNAHSKPGMFKNPLTLIVLDFKGSAVDEMVELEWSTIEDVNASRFVIEYSLNGFDFEEIGSLASNGSSIKNSYSFRHNFPVSETYNLYRLKFFDNRGSFIYSDIIDVYMEDSNDFDIKILSNPSAKEVIHISIKGLKNKEAQLIIQDLSGNMVYSGMLENYSGSFIIYKNDVIPGIYVVTAIKEGYVKRKKIIIPE